MPIVARIELLYIKKSIIVYEDGYNNSYNMRKDTIL